MIDETLNIQMEFTCQERQYWLVQLRAKKYVINRAKPIGSIAKGHVIDGTLTYTRWRDSI